MKSTEVLKLLKTLKDILKPLNCLKHTVKTFGSFLSLGNSNEIFRFCNCIIITSEYVYAHYVAAKLNNINGGEDIILKVLKDNLSTSEKFKTENTFSTFNK